MQSFWFGLAAAIAAITFYVHTFIGGPRVAVPLLADAHLPKASKWLNYYCWHIVTILLAAMAMSFAAVAIGWSSPDVAWLLGGLSLLFSLLSIFVAVKGEINPLRFPSTTLFALVAIATLGGALS
ncbi:hypothetical protein [Nitratireductor soli]|uniref:hypothetical protein n=1 Tax=Nitratireductor soli TaxID=1670619 RepID=UPI000AC3825B|nr:hypothetical protein [Nitratireductor soli]